MEGKYQIVSDSSCDFTIEMAEQENVDVVPFYVSFDDEEYRKEVVEVPIREFYQQMIELQGVYPKSSTPSTQDYYETFEKYVKAGTQVLCLCISSKFSGSIQAASNAKNMILEDYPEAVIEVVDTMVNTVLQGSVVLEACRMRDAGYELMQTVESIESIRETGRIFFTVGDLEYLKHGGRIGKLAGIAGGLLGIKPLIVEKEGEIFSGGVARSRKKSMCKVLDLMEEYMIEQDATQDSYRICIGYGDSYEEGLEFRDKAIKRLEKYGVTEIPMFQIGATIGVHTGPYPLGITLVKRGLKS